MARLALTSLLLLVLSAATPGAALAHAVLLETSPADGVALAEPPEAITLHFNEPVRPVSLRILHAEQETEVEPAAVVAIDKAVRVSLPEPLADGTYLVSYRVISADTHPVGGAFVFTVGTVDRRTDPDLAILEDHDAAWQVAATMARALWYGPLLLAAGFGLFLALIRPPENVGTSLRRALPWLAGGGIVAGVLALGVSGGAMLGEAGQSLLTPRPWRVAATSPIAASLVSASLGLVLLGLDARRGGRWLLFGGAGLVALSFALSGHTATAPPRWLSVPALAAHTLLVAFWIGALWPLLLAARRMPHDQAAEVLAALSRLALPAVGVLVVAGGVLAWIQLQSVSDLVATDYGQRLALKLALVAGLLGLAAVNRWLLAPALAADRAGARLWLRRTLGADLVLAALVVLLTASLGAVPPPRTLHVHDHARHHDHAPHDDHAAHHDPAAHPAREDYAVHATAPGGQLVLVATPARVGANRFDLYLTDDAGDPLDAIEAELRLSLPEQGIEALRVEADRLAPGRFEAPEAVLPVPGSWQVRADLLVDDFTKLIFRARIEVAR